MAIFATLLLLSILDMSNLSGHFCKKSLDVSFTTRHRKFRKVWVGNRERHHTIQALILNRRSHSMNQGIKSPHPRNNICVDKKVIKVDVESVMATISSDCESNSAIHSSITYDVGHSPFLSLS